MRKIIGAGIIATGIIMLASAAVHSAPPPAEFVRQAGASDLFEITSSKMVATSTDPKVKAFANQMIVDHTKSTEAVKAAAIRSGLKPMPPKLTPKQAADVAALRSASGSARDALYISQQKTAHSDALALHRDNAATGAAPALKAASAKIVPVVEHHKMEIDSM